MIELNMYEAIFMITMIGVITLMATSIIKTMLVILKNVLAIIGALALAAAIMAVVINYM